MVPLPTSREDRLRITATLFINRNAVPKFCILHFEFCIHKINAQRSLIPNSSFLISHLKNRLTLVRRLFNYFLTFSFFSFSDFLASFFACFAAAFSAFILSFSAFSAAIFLSLSMRAFSIALSFLYLASV